jgi:hypothetical protein
VSVAVVFPWRFQPARVRAFDYVRTWWSRQLPDAQQFEVDTDHEPFNLAACRNLGVRHAEAAGASVVVIADADCVIGTPAALHAAISEAHDDQLLHLPFTEQRYLTESETNGLYWGADPPLRGSHGNGACYVVAPSAYWAAGGQDERFSGWGGDDDQLIASAATLTGVSRHRGVVWSLWHADECRDVGSERHRPNSELAARYWAAKGDRDAILAIIAER